MNPHQHIRCKHCGKQINNFVRLSQKFCPLSTGNDCARKYNRIENEKKLEKRRAIVRKSYHKNKHKYKEKRDEWNKRNSKEIKIKRLKYQRTTKFKRKKRLMYYKNREKRLKYQRDYYRKHPEILQKNRERRNKQKRTIKAWIIRKMRNDSRKS